MRDAKLYNAVRQLAFVRGLRFSFRAGRVELWRSIFTGTLPQARAFLAETPRISRSSGAPVLAGYVHRPVLAGVSGPSASSGAALC